MNTANWISVLRWAATAVLGGLTAAWTYYPGAKWIPIAIAVLFTAGIHVLPTSPQLADRLAFPARKVTVPVPEDKP
jgi:hypothetical protein